MDKIVKALKLAKSKKAFLSSLCNENNIKNRKYITVDKRINIKTFYFSSKYSDILTKEFIKNSKACIYFKGGIFSKGLMLEGNIEILNDMENKELIWKNEMGKIYKNGGINDPDYCVLKFTANYGNIYIKNKMEVIEFI